MHITLGAYLISGTPGYRQAGVHQYARQLMFALDTLAQHTDHLQLSAWVSPTATNEVRGLAATQVHTASRSTENPARRIWVEQVETPNRLSGTVVEVYHGLLNVLPLRLSCPSVVSVMDLSFITQPQTHQRLNRLYLSAFTRWSCRKANRIIAISAWTKRDLVKHFGISPDKIDAIPLGVDPHFRPALPEATAAFKQQHGIGDHAVFFLGSIEPRKNLARLLEAFAQLNSNWSTLNQPPMTSDPLPPTPQLFIGGSLGWKYEALLSQIQQMGLGERVKLIGRVAHEDLPSWYSACGVFAFPSLYEGFGLPPLEAMACGAPVIGSNVTSLPEVIGDAGLLIDPHDTAALARALMQVLSDAALQRTMRERSIQQAASFTWQRTALETIHTYERVMGGAT